MAKIGPGVEARKRRLAAPTTAGSAAQNERTNERVGGGGLGDGYSAFSSKRLTIRRSGQELKMMSACVGNSGQSGSRILLQVQLFTSWIEKML